MTIMDRLGGVREGQAVKSPVRVATTGNITLSGLQTVDGVVLVTNDRVLVKDQTDAKLNGIYVASAGDWQRAVDFQGFMDAVKGTRVYVNEGAASAGASFSVTGNVEFGSTNINFTRDVVATAIASGFATRAAAASATIPTGQSFIQTSGYSSPGDGGGAEYKVEDTDPSSPGQIALANGKFAYISSRTPNPFMFGARDDGDEWDSALADYFNYMLANPEKPFDVNGTFGMTQGLNLGPSTGTVSNLKLIGNLELTALGAIDTMVTMRNTNNLNWDGFLSLVGTGGTSYSSRTCGIGMALAANTRPVIGGVIADNLYFHSIIGSYGDVNTNFATMGDLRAIDCGSGSRSTGTSDLTASFSNPVETGSAGSGTQRTTFTVSVLPPALIDNVLTWGQFPIFVFIDQPAKPISNITRGATTTVTLTNHGFQNGDSVTFAGITGTTELNGVTATVREAGSGSFKVYINSSGYGAYVSGGTATKSGNPICRWIESIDRVNNTITVYPWVSPHASSGTLTYVFGGGMLNRGANGNIHSYNKHDATRCGLGFTSAATNCPIIMRPHAQDCGIGLVIGARPDAAGQGTTIIDGYWENNNVIHIAKLLTATTVQYSYLQSASNLNPEKCITFPLLSASYQPSATSSGAGFQRFPMALQGRNYAYEKPARQAGESGSSLALEITSDRPLRLFKRDSWTINLTGPQNWENDLFGIDSATVIFPGSGTFGQPTGTFTFNPPAGATVNGGSSATFSGFSGPAFFCGQWRADKNDYEVRCIAGKLNVLSSTSGTPEYVGQIAVTGGAGYMAVGTSSSADWKQITN